VTITAAATITTIIIIIIIIIIITLEQRPEKIFTQNTAFLCDWILGQRHTALNQHI